MNQNEEFLSPNEIFEMFTQEKKEYTIENLADDLNLPIEKLYDMTLDEISELSKMSINTAKQKTQKIQQFLDKRNSTVNKIKKAQVKQGLESQDLTKIYFEDLKNNK